MNIEIQNLIKTYGKESAIHIDTLDLKDIHTLAIVGPSGGGKSTLLKLLGTIEIADSGSLKVNEIEIVGLKDPKSYLHEIGFVFQHDNLFPNLTVLQNVTIHLIYTYQMDEKEATTLAEKWLNKVGILEHKDKKVHQLSGGQAQRAAIVRALITGAKLLMLDEPTSALDPELAYEVMMTLMHMKEETDMIIVTHELNFARRFADYYLFVEEGGILAHGPIEQLFAHENSRIQEFVNKITFK
ncbi:amino acid ABC transporter ATP-binding protein [Niameybacter massiliensis]|uniref:amino acid ABC transporter ATP-binding protein n=1 Tax=Niameybacter massiliensis TaxID=1658108 RepID=UPI0006B67BD4|nr:ATP-binding cassette domain-containing protein [Niameybacter massiliensis]